MSSSNWLVIGGIYHLAFAVFHMFFWKIFNWKQSLSSISKIDSGVMQVMNLCLIWIFLSVGYISIVHTDQMLKTTLGHVIIALIAVFWLFRAVLQVIFFSLKKTMSKILLALFVIGVIIYATPIFTILLVESVMKQL